MNILCRSYVALYRSILMFYFVANGSNYLLATYQLGIENTDDIIWTLLKNSERKPMIGLITNQTGKDQKGIRTIDILLQRGLQVKRMFAPEHGLDGLTHAEHTVDDIIDSTTNIPVISLYGNGSGKKLQTHTIADLDMLFF